MSKINYILVVVLCQLWPTYLSAQTSTDTLKLYFDTDQASFNKKTRSMLDSLLYNDLILTNRAINIIGYTDYVGAEEYNNRLSQSRAQYVANYFVGMGVKNSQIKQRIGKGEILRQQEKNGGYQSDRRVDVVVSVRFKKEAITSKNSTVKTAPPVLQKIDIATGSTFVLDNIYFYAGRHVVKPESLKEIDKLYNALVVNPKLSIQIEGHVCCVRFAPDALDEDTDELALSANRAKYIYEYLVQKGIDSSRLKYHGFGRSRPIVIKERSAEDEDKNRRVEIRVLSK